MGIQSRIIHRVNRFAPGLLPPYSLSSAKTRSEPVRPYFGVLSGTGGPWTRTRRLSQSFGNHFLDPNLIYANSAGIVSPKVIARYLAARPKTAVILNQNGLYYPGWYSGDCLEKNREIQKLANLSDYILFQSDFCRGAYESLIGKVDRPFEILLNACPDLFQGALHSTPVPWSFVLSGVFSVDSEHILRPALKAFQIFAERGSQEKPKLILGGHFTEGARGSDWFTDIWGILKKLEAQGMVILKGAYSSEAPGELFSLAEAALHLKYKDPCPNAVIERMSFGLPHIYSNSGGTPELVGDAGIALSVPETWDRQAPVNVDELVAAIDQMKGRFVEPGARARQRYEAAFSWSKYVERHSGIFKDWIQKKC